eukprot:TRINITY_DN3495_c0_g1_i1.p1 TRINITY_DN3495_c0_g1~~TRINITY_DN3495_c0_g1_i1.p1  ORF type:complete len:673 (-),score=205.91 TRINITY_DN3495_c0_g1_i1:42-2060(-)
MRINIVILLLLSFIIASYAWNKADTNKAIETINSKQQNEGSWESLYETYSAVQTLDMLGAKNINKKDNICKGLNDQINKVTKASDIYYVLATYKKLKCGSDVPTKLIDNLKVLLKKPDELTTEELRYLVGNIPLIGGAEKLASNTLGKLIEIITDRMEDKGIFRSLKDVEDASVLNAGHAFRALAQLHRLKVGNKQQNEMLETSIDSLSDLIKFATKGADDTIYFTDNKEDNIETTSVVIEGIFTILTSVKKSKATTFLPTIQGFANFFASSKASTEKPSEIYQIVRSLHTLSRNSLQRPVSISLHNSRISTSAPAEERTLRVDVSNSLGEPIPGIKVYLAKAKAIKSSAVLVERQLMDLQDNTFSTYTFNLFAAKPLPGSYILTVRVVPDNKENHFEATSTDLTISIVTSVSLTGTTFTVSDTNSREQNSAKKTELTYPNNLSAGSFKTNQHLFLSFRVKNEKTQKPIVVSQTVVRVVNEATGRELNIIAFAKGTQYSAHFDFSQNSQFWALGGLFQAHLIVGDAHIERGIYWKVVSFELPADPSKIKPSVWDQEPVINHIFRLPEKRPPAVVSLAFTGLVLAPILLIFVGLGFTGFTFGKLPSLGYIYYILFIAGICLIAFVIVLYFLAFNMFTALYYISVLLVFTIIVGQKALRSKALASLESEKQKID